MNTKKEAATIDKTAFRYYFGHTLNAFIQLWPNQPHEEVLNNAAEWAILACEKEKQRT